jgi:hypothetical protein
MGRLTVLKGGDASRAIQSQIADDDKDKIRRIQFKETEVKKLAITALLIVVLTMVVAVPTMAAPTLHKVTGGGTLAFPGFDMESYGLTARQTNEDGTGTGHVHMTWHYPSAFSGATPWIMNSEVLYLAVDADAGEAWIGAVITSSNDPYLMGMEYVLRVIDGGKGRDAGEDMISATDLSRSAIEALDMPTDGGLAILAPWANGNVHIQ